MWTAIFQVENPGAGFWWADTITHILLLTVAILLSVAAVILADRKIWAAVQMRKGPNVVGAFGVLQPFADLFKFVFKEMVVPAGADRPLFLLAPVLTVILAFGAWAVIPVAPGWVVADINVGILYILAISSLQVYGVMIGGWASNSKYPFLGALRSAAQMVSYEVSIGFIIISVLVLVGSMNLTDIVMAQGGGIQNWHAFAWPTIFILFPMFVMFFISVLAETNRPPFDLPEAESELVAGYQVEYSSTPFLLYFLGEYVSILLMCALMTVLFLGGWHGPVTIDALAWFPPALTFVAKMAVLFFMIAMVKAIVPRYRYDQLMRLGWKVFLPTSLVAVAVMGGYQVYVNAGG